jgi:hypothetical protein
MFNLGKLSPSITDMIRMDHTHVMLSFHQYTAGAKPRWARTAWASWARG